MAVCTTALAAFGFATHHSPGRACPGGGVGNATGGMNAGGGWLLPGVVDGEPAGGDAPGGLMPGAMDGEPAGGDAPGGLAIGGNGAGMAGFAWGGYKQ